MANLIITSVGTSKLQSALVGGTKVQLVSFSTGYTSGSVSSANTSVPAQNYGLAPINSAQKIDDNSSQYECIVPESVGTFAINTIGLWDQDNTLFAIAKLGTDFSKIAQNLPTNPGNRFVWRPQIHISNISAVMNWTLNVATISNLNSVNIPSNLSGLAFAGQYKTYRVITMPDGDADIAISDGNNWSFGRYIPDFTGSTSGTATADNKIKGDATVPWKSYHVGSLVQINSGGLQYQVRAITSVDESTNEATVNTNFASIPGTGISILVFSKFSVLTSGLIPFGTGSWRAGLDPLFLYDSTNKRLGNRKTSPTVGYHQLGGNLRLEKLADPTSPTVVPQGTTGVTSYVYYVVAEDYEGKRTSVSPATTIGNGNAVLSGINFNRITWSTIAGAKQYRVLKGNTATLVGTTTGTQFDDTGQSTSIFSPPTRNETADAVIDGKLTVSQAPSATTDVVRLLELQSYFPAGTRILFQQTTLPTGWVKDTTHNNKALRLVNGSVGSGGSTSFTSVFGSGLITGSTALSVAQMPPHNHTVDGTVVPGSGLQGAPSSSGTGTRTTSTTGSGQGHTHTLSLDLMYVDIVIGQKS